MNISSNVFAFWCKNVGTFWTLLDSGARITIGSDFPVVESFNPFLPLQAIVMREGESVPISTALEFVTRNAAQSVGMMDKLGTIEAGKIANMVVLDRNLLEIPLDEIGDTRVLKTILDGELVYEKQTIRIDAVTKNETIRDRVQAVLSYRMTTCSRITAVQLRDTCGSFGRQAAGFGNPDFRLNPSGCKISRFFSMYVIS